jgi:arabinogalactan endo-1,4-beta-galactosidase
VRTLCRALCLLALIASARAGAAEFMAGADISSLPVFEANGAVYTDDVVAGGVIPMFRDHGVNWYRLRLFVDPSNDDDLAAPGFQNDAFVVQDLPYTIALAERVKAAGGKVLLDFHYSDTWADPGKQYKPAEWAGLNFATLTTRVHDYTRDAVAAFREAGALPEMVQIGNEIANGMIWNDGRLWRDGVSEETEFANLAALVSAGINGARAGAGPEEPPLVMVHHDKGANWSTSSYFFDRLLQKLETNGTDVDVIGYSYYPKWHYNPTSGAGGIADLRTTLNNTADRYDKPVVVVETGFASRNASGEPTYEFPKTAAGQRQFLDAVVDAVQDVPGDMGWGAFWWYAEARPSAGLNVWEGGRYGLFDQTGALLPTIDAFAGLNPPPGDYNGDGIVSGADLAAWQAAFGQTGASLAADGDGDGAVDGADFLFWQRRLSDAGSGVQTAPEPDCLGMAAACVFAAIASQRRRPFAGRRSRRGGRPWTFDRLDGPGPRLSTVCRCESSHSAARRPRANLDHLRRETLKNWPSPDTRL